MEAGRRRSRKSSNRATSESLSSRGLGCDPLTVETRVRIPLGTPDIFKE